MPTIADPRTLSQLEMDVLAVCGGFVRKLPYNNEQGEALCRLVDLGLAEHVIEDDQPTAYTTERGAKVLRDLGINK